MDLCGVRLAIQGRAAGQISGQTAAGMECLALDGNKVNCSGMRGPSYRDLDAKNVAEREIGMGLQYEGRHSESHPGPWCFGQFVDSPTSSFRFSHPHLTRRQDFRDGQEPGLDLRWRRQLSNFNAHSCPNTSGRMKTAILPHWTVRAPYRSCWSTVAQRGRFRDHGSLDKWVSSRQPSLRYFRQTSRNLKTKTAKAERAELRTRAAELGPLLGPTHLLSHKELAQLLEKDRELRDYAHKHADTFGSVQHLPHSELLALLNTDGGYQLEKAGQEAEKARQVYEQDEAVVRKTRQTYGDELPEGLLEPSQRKIYVRLYGEPVVQEEGEHVSETGLNEELDEQPGTGVMVEGRDGSLEEVAFDEDDYDIDEDGPRSFEDMLNSQEFIRLRKSKLGKFYARATKKELDETVIFAEMNKSDEAALAYLDREWKRMDQDDKAVYLDDVRYLKLEQYLRDRERNEEADELLQCLFIFIESRAIAQGKLSDQATEIQEVEEGSEETSLEIRDGEELEETLDDADSEDQYLRRHPLTVENRFSTNPATVQLPKSSFSGPVSAIISGTSPTHLSDAAQRIFGPGLMYSTSTPHFAKSRPQKPIPLDVSSDKMSDIDSDAYFAAVMPGTYASLMSVLVETRKRLGSDWLTSLMNKEGGPRILDAGSGGAGVVAFREMLRAEWERINDDSQDPGAAKGLATIDGREGGAPAEGPMGRATVLVGSATLRQRASVLLDDTTFIPRLPDYVHASDPQAAQHGKFDVILAPHSLWSLKEEFLRKQYVANLWSLLNADGGVLILLEKGVPRGFEVIAGARKFLLDTRIASPGQETAAEEVTDPREINIQGVREKGKGMIIGPCTNHAPCPMYTRPGVSSGRKDYCHFEQRFVRPPYLQKLLGAKDKNHEDVKFSYLSIMRGRDLRSTSSNLVVQGDAATAAAFEGYEHPTTLPPEPIFDPTAPALETFDSTPTTSAGPHSLSLPRLVLPPLKRTGHIILDLCTPSGTLERWTVSKSFSRQAFRDARKSTWGDLWALGAKTRVPKNVRLGSSGQAKGVMGGIDLKTVRVKGKARREMAEKPEKRSKGLDIYDVPVDRGTGKTGDVKKVSGGRMRRGKISGVRDKRNKSGKVRVRKGEVE
ncbi:hypothetical protein K461DRAFT_314424 [Myriangium duriaei CBS 260.36]|uniref:Uncharacterized protein n=1 Tax=Myriangium duriaei CBS 260.36 TaxID=1168546 RepID=A0A9P4IZ74_9PEZI|nr:hypothetical protein K461DRAFT_314424 [Myriangium duriaei CBS 260.36]